MITLKTISESLNLIDAKKQNLKKAFDDLQSFSLHHLSWPHLDSHFTSRHQSLTHRFNLLQSHKLPNYPQPPSPSPSNSNAASSTGAFPQNDVVSGSAIPRRELSVLCEKMDGVGLRDYVLRHFKDRVKVEAELPGALRCAPDPAEMVLGALEGFHGVGNGSKERDLRKKRKCCLMLLKQLRVANPSLSSKAREKATAVAKDWEQRLVADSGDVVAALGFLHLLAAFGLVSEFGADELVDYSVAAAVSGEFSELCRITGLTDRVPDIVQKLIGRGKHILAVKYVYELNLVDKFPPVAILKACVDESKELSKRLSQEGKTLTEITTRETHTLKSVIMIIENHKLESGYPRASLDHRIEELKNMRRPSPDSAAKPPHHQQLQKRKMQKQKQKQSGVKRHQTSAPVGHAAGRMNVNSGYSTMHQYQEQLIHPSGLFPERPHVPSGLFPEHPHVPSGYYDGASAYGGIGLQYYYQTSRYPQ